MSQEPMTPEGLKKLKEELKRYKFVERLKNVKDIEVARAHGDLRENAEYHAAKDRQGHIAAQIQFLEDAIARAVVIDPQTLKSDKVVFGATITLLEVEIEETITYQIVGKHESNLKVGRISVDAPLSKVLIGKTVGDTVVFKSAKGVKEYEILEIKFL